MTKQSLVGMLRSPNGEHWSDIFESIDMAL